MCHYGPTRRAIRIRRRKGFPRPLEGEAAQPCAPVSTCRTRTRPPGRASRRDVRKRYAIHCANFARTLPSTPCRTVNERLTSRKSRSGEEDGRHAYSEAERKPKNVKPENRLAFSTVSGKKIGLLPLKTKSIDNHRRFCLFAMAVFTRQLLTKQGRL